MLLLPVCCALRSKSKLHHSVQKGALLLTLCNAVALKKANTKLRRDLNSFRPCRSFADGLNCSTEACSTELHFDYMTNVQLCNTALSHIYSTSSVIILLLSAWSTAS
jgi:hypothetical protein